MTNYRSKMVISLLLLMYFSKYFTMI